MKQSITIDVPTSWKDITLKKYLELQSELNNYEDNEEAQTALLLYHLCGINAAQLKTISNKSYNELKDTMLSFMSNNQLPLQKIILIDGVEYGFEPNLSRMSYGAYCDITKFTELAIDKNWAKIMRILYRPVEKKFLNTYAIKPYNGEIDDTLFLPLTMDIHFGAFFFFVHLSRDLVSSTLNYLTKTEEDIPHSIKQILVRSGELMQPL